MEMARLQDDDPALLFPEADLHRRAQHPARLFPANLRARDLAAVGKHRAGSSQHDGISGFLVGGAADDRDSLAAVVDSAERLRRVQKGR